MQNELIKKLEDYRGKVSYRQLAKELNYSHSFTTDVMTGKRNVTWGFVWMAARLLRLPFPDALEMSGLLASVTEKRSAGATGAK